MRGVSFCSRDTPGTPKISFKCKTRVFEPPEYCQKFRGKASSFPAHPSNVKTGRRPGTEMGLRDMSFVTRTQDHSATYDKLLSGAYMR